MKSTIVALILFSSTATTTTGFQLALTGKIINYTRRTKTPPSTRVTAVPSQTSSVSSSEIFRRRNLLKSPAATPVETPTCLSVSTHRNNKDDTTAQVVNKTKKINNKRIIALLVTTSCLLLSIIHRPTVAYAAATTIIPPSPSSLLSSTSTTSSQIMIDPATLTTTTDGFTVLNSNNNNMLSKLFTTTLATIQMKQQSMTMFALALGITIALLKCAEGGYVKLVEFMASKVCLGYYGMNCNNDVGDNKRKKVVGWNEYVQRLPRRRKEGGVVAVDKDEHYGKKKFVLDNKTMLFQPLLTKVTRGRGDDIMMERANQSYREKQHEQHQHHDKDKSLSATATAASSTHLDDTPSSHSSSWDKYKTTLHTRTQTQVEHDETSEKLQILKNLVSWQDYKHLVTELQRKKEECSRLQEEVDTLTKRLLEVEERTTTVHQHQQQHRSTPTPDVVVVDSDDGGDDYEKELELKTLADKAKEYDETIQESKVKNGDSVRWH